MRISRTRLSGRWSYLQEDDVNRGKTLSGRDLPPATQGCSRQRERVTDDSSAVGFGWSGLASLPLRPELALRHWRSGLYRTVISRVSTFLDPFAPSELPDFHATMGPLTPAGPARAVLTPAGLSGSCAGPSDHSASNHPTCPVIALTHYPSASRASGSPRSGLRLSLAGSPHGKAESSSLALRTQRFPARP